MTINATETARDDLGTDQLLSGYGLAKRPLNIAHIDLYIEYVTYSRLRG
jgi:hypothetical protein